MLDILEYDFSDMIHVYFIKLFVFTDGCNRASPQTYFQAFFFKHAETVYLTF